MSEIDLVDSELISRLYKTDNEHLLEAWSDLNDVQPISPSG